MSITWMDLTGVDEDLARRAIVVARSIAPCFEQLNGEPKANAIAILRGVLAEAGEVGSRRVRSLSRNGTTMSFADMKSAFTTDDRAALRSLCGLSGVAGLPRGSFPADRIVSGLWPESGRS